MHSEAVCHRLTCAGTVSGSVRAVTRRISVSLRRALSKGCSRREAPENADGSGRRERRHSL